MSVTAETPARPQANRYPPKVIRYARELWERGRGIEEIRQTLGRYGPVPSWSTVRRWVDDDYAQAVRLKNRLGARTGRRVPAETVVPFLLRRMTDLRAAGLSFADIAAVLRLDLGLRLTDNQVRYIVRGQTSRESVALLLKGQRARSGRPATSVLTEIQGAELP